MSLPTREGIQIRKAPATYSHQVPKHRCESCETVPRQQKQHKYTLLRGMPTVTKFVIVSNIPSGGICGILFWHSILAFYLASILTFSLTWALPDLNCEHQISVGTASARFQCGVVTEIWRLWLPGSAHWNPDLAVEVRQRPRDVELAVEAWQCRSWGRRKEGGRNEEEGTAGKERGRTQLWENPEALTIPRDVTCTLARR